MFKGFIPRLRGLIFNLLSGDRGWALFRLIAVALLIAIGIMLVFWMVDVSISFLNSARETYSDLFPAPPATPTPTATPPGWKPTEEPPAPTNPLMDLIIDIAREVRDGVRELVNDFRLRIRYGIAALWALALGVIVGARYLQDIYELPSYSAALRYLLSSIFALGRYPRLVIAEGKKQIQPYETNLLDKIGGPGYVIIRPGNLALFERLRSPSSVRGAGVHFISRFETVKEIISLEEQDVELDTVKAATKDGIEVTVSKVRFRYRLLAGPRLGNNTGRTPEDPYPFSTQAVKNMVYNRTVNANGLSFWWFALKNVVESAITDYINTHTLDQLIAPNATNEDPRGAIRATLFGKGVRAGLRNLGAELIACDIGHFELSKDYGSLIADQRLATWRAHWEGKADVMRADAEAQRWVYQELGRAEAQAEMLMSITRALEDIDPQGDSQQHLHNLVLMRTAQILEAISEGRPQGESNKQKNAPGEKPVQ